MGGYEDQIDKQWAVCRVCGEQRLPGEDIDIALEES